MVTHWLILLVVVVVIFGTSKLKNAGKDLGGAVKGFKDAVKDDNEQHATKNRVVEHTKKPSLPHANPTKINTTFNLTAS